jgi:hypothetical protein
MRSIKRGLWVVVTVLACLAWESPAAGASQKLFLKDGTYQLVSSYEVHGDRVRYYSVERSEWEEVPLSLVDLEATKRAQKEEEATQKKELEEGHEIVEERFYKPPETGFEVAPGIRLPKEDGVFAFDGIRVIRLIQSTPEVVTDKRRAAFAMAVPGHLLKGQVILELPGPRAAVRLQQAMPTFYVQSSEGLGAKMELFPVKVVKESRVVEKVEASRSGLGKAEDTPAAVQLQRTQVAPGLYCLKLLQPLDPGEYALGDLAQQGITPLLWSFGLFETPPTKQEMKRQRSEDSERK